MYHLYVDLDPQGVIASIVTDSGLSESSESAVTLTTDNLQQHVIASASATIPVTVTQTLPVGLGVIGSNNYGTTGLSSGPAAAVGVNVGVVNTAALMEMGHSRNSSNTSQVSTYITINQMIPLNLYMRKRIVINHSFRCRCQRVRVIVVFRTVNIRGKVLRVTRGMLGKLLPMKNLADLF